ncbi:hypothetical protein HDU67_003487, partial [Dinochytrium kinnereticum]
MQERDMRELEEAFKTTDEGFKSAGKVVERKHEVEDDVEVTTCLDLSKVKPYDGVGPSYEIRSTRSTPFTIYWNGSGIYGEDPEENRPTPGNFKKMMLEKEVKGGQIALIDAPKFIDVACGSESGYAIAEDFKLITWGEGRASGRITMEKFSAPDYVCTVTRFKRVVASNHAGAAIDAMGDLWIWGCFMAPNNENFLLRETAYSQTPQNITSKFASPVIDIAAGSNHMVVLLLSGEVWGWGVNTYASLGNLPSPNENSDQCYPPGRRLMLPSSVRANRVFAGGVNTYVIGMMVDGRPTVYGCGDNSYGELGFDTLDPIPALQHLDDYDFSSIVSGEFHTLFVYSDGEMRGCGSFICGEIGKINEEFFKEVAPRPICLRAPPCIMAAIATNGYHS